jgi:flagellar biosynthesis/type III secretory pathway chaperone
MSALSATGTLADLQLMCDRISHLLEREYSILRSRNGLIGDGAGQLDELHQEKEQQIAVLDQISRTGTCIDEARAAPERASAAKQSIERCKSLQARNQQLFGRIVHAQKRILSVLRAPEDAVSLYDRGGRYTDFGMINRSERA